VVSFLNDLMIENIGIIDLGTNSIRFDIYTLDHTTIVNRLFRLKEMVRLGEGVFQTQKLHPKAIERCMQAFEHIAAKIKEFNVQHTVAFATSALRSAKDADEFVAKVEKKFKIKIQVITGEREALLISKGITNNEILPNDITALIDIGGGSTELNITYKHTLIDSISFELGAARLQQIFLDGNEHINKRLPAVNELRFHVREKVRAFAQGKKWLPLYACVGTSGTVRAIAKMIKKHGKSTEPFYRRDLKTLVEKLIPLNRDELLKVPGMEERRVDLIIPGVLLFEQMIEELHIEEIYTSEVSLRDGILDEEIENYLRPSIT
jgi:exopolyphosphatase/guanosine-5'-triphosphate,3'-diphosphate pyrophosphatase